jgi:hypothetical protein
MLENDNVIIRNIRSKNGFCEACKRRVVWLIVAKVSEKPVTSDFLVEEETFIKVYQTTRLHVPKHGNLYREKLKS